MCKSPDPILRRGAFPVCFAFAILLSWRCVGSSQVNVLTQHNDLERTGTNLHETELKPANVTMATFGMLFKHVVDDQVYSQPLYVSDMEVGGGTHDLVYITTVNNSVYAFDAKDADRGTPVWHVNFGTPANLYDAKFGCLDINGNMGIIGTPVIDREHGALYVVALTRAGKGFQQRLHALDLATGADLDNSPVVITAPAFDPLLQNQRPALLLSRGTVYVGYASHCDHGPYHGFLLAYDASSLRQTAVLNTSPAGDGASIWHSGQGPAADRDGNIYVVTGNGTWNGSSDFSESFLKLSPDLKLLDWFTPSNHQHLDDVDDDLDSSGASLIPGTNVVLGGGKEGVLYGLDTMHLGHLGDEHALQHFQATASHLHNLVYWESEKNGPLLYVWGQRDKARVYRVAHGRVSEKTMLTRAEVNEGHPGAMLSLSANGGKDGILWAAIHATGDSWHESRPGILHAYLADDIRHELWNSYQDRPRDDCGNYSKMAPPTVANGRVYLPSFGAANTGSGQLCVYGLLPRGAPPGAPTGLRATVNDGVVALAWEALPGVSFYRVAVADGTTGVSRTIVSGLTTPRYQGIQAPLGTTSYSVSATSSDGTGPESAPVRVEVLKPGAVERMQH